MSLNQLSGMAFQADYGGGTFAFTTLSLVIPEIVSAIIRDRRTEAARSPTGTDMGSPIPARPDGRPG